jgi:hypothetical protein
VERGQSYRLDIWQDVIRRLFETCNIWVGCAPDDGLILGLFSHPHNVYLSILYNSGVTGALLFGCLLLMIVRQGWRSDWFLLAIFGLGAMLTESKTMFTSPQPLWVYFWLPTFMAILDGQREVVLACLNARRTG